MPSGVKVPLERRSLPVVRDGPAGIVAVFATIPGEGEDRSTGVSRSLVRMASATTGSGNRLLIL